MPDPVTYRVVHKTRYVYSNAVTNARQLAHLKPRTAPWQTVRAHHIEIDPAPSEQFEGVDYFGNSVMHFAVETPHEELTVRAESIVEVQSHAPETDAGPEWEGAFAAPGVWERDSELDVVQFRLASPMVPVLPESIEYARASFPAGRALPAALLDLTRRIQEAREDVSDARDDHARTKAEQFLAQLTTLEGAILPA